MHVLGNINMRSDTCSGSYCIVFCIVSATSNVAVNKPAQHSSIFGPNALAAKAVDGNTDRQFSGGSCMCTNTITVDTNPWWTVDLGGTYDVSDVILYNRADCCGMC
jgi:hypothetical protein